MVYRCWEAGETADHKGFWRSHIRNLYLLVTLWAASQGMHLCEGLLSVQGPCRPCGQTK